MTRKFNTFYCTAIIASLCLFSQDTEAGGRKFGLSSFSPGVHAVGKVRVAPRITNRMRNRVRRVTVSRAAKHIGIVGKRRMTHPVTFNPTRKTAKKWKKNVIQQNNTGRRGLVFSSTHLRSKKKDGSSPIVGKKITVNGNSPAPAGRPFTADTIAHETRHNHTVQSPSDLVSKRSHGRKGSSAPWNFHEWTSASKGQDGVIVRGWNPEKKEEIVGEASKKEKFDDTSSVWLRTSQTQTSGSGDRQPPLAQFVWGSNKLFGGVTLERGYTAGWGDGWNNGAGIDTHPDFMWIPRTLSGHNADGGAAGIGEFKSSTKGQDEVGLLTPAVQGIRESYVPPTPPAKHDDDCMSCD